MEATPPVFDTDQEKLLRALFFWDEPDMIHKQDKPHLNMNAISSKLVFDKQYGGTVFVPPYAITIMWYFDRTIGEFMGAFNPEGVSINVARVEKAIQEKERERDDKLPAVTSTQASLDAAKAAFDSAKKGDKKRLGEVMNQTILSKLKAYREYDAIDKEVKKLQEDLASFNETYNESTQLLKIYLENNNLKIPAIASQLEEFVSRADNTQPFYCFIPICLRRILSKNATRLSGHANGLFLVKRPGESFKVILIEPMGSDTNDTTKVNEIRLRKSVLAICGQILGRHTANEWLQIRTPPPQYYTKDENCIFWTRFIVNELIQAINRSGNGVPTKQVVTDTILAMTTPETLPKLGGLIEQYKLQTVVPTIPAVLNKVFPDDGTPLGERIKTAMKAAKAANDTSYTTEMQWIEYLYVVVANKFGYYGGRNRRRTRKQTRTYKQCLQHHRN